MIAMNGVDWRRTPTPRVESEPAVAPQADRRVGRQAVLRGEPVTDHTSSATV